MHYTAKANQSQLFFKTYRKEGNKINRRKASGHPFCHLFSAEDMEMKMLNRLASIRAAVGYNTVAVGQVFLCSDGTYCAQAFGQITVSSAVCVIKGRKVLFRNNENMHRGLRINIPEGIYIVVFKYLLGRDFTFYDFAKKTVFHNSDILSVCFIYDLTVHNGRIRIQKPDPDGLSRNTAVNFTQTYADVFRRITFPTAVGFLFRNQRSG